MLKRTTKAACFDTNNRIESGIELIVTIAYSDRDRVGFDLSFAACEPFLHDELQETAEPLRSREFFACQYLGNFGVNAFRIGCAF